MFTLSDDQKISVNDIMSFLADDVPGEMILGGKAGTGKTYLTKYILEEIDTDPRMKAHRLLAKNTQGKIGSIHLCSTTNKAASILGQATGHQAVTIHRLLGLTVRNNHETGESDLVPTKRTKVIEESLIIIDEASMISKKLLQTIRDLTFKCKVLFIGDPYQLAPVKETTSPVFVQIPEQTHLTKIQRQAANSSIIRYADLFRNAVDTGVFPQIQSCGTDVIHLDAQDFMDEIDRHFYQVPHKNFARIVAWSNNAIHVYNKKIRALNNLPTKWTVGEYALSNTPIHFAEKVVVSTDSIVQITDIGPEDSYEGIKGHMFRFENNAGSEYSVFQANNQTEVNRLVRTLVKQKRWKDKFTVEEFFSDFRPMYANTINKAQGSTYENVFIDLNDIGRNTQNTNIARLMYTAITRAANKVYMCGQLPDRLY